MKNNPKLWNEIVRRTCFLDEYYEKINEEVPIGARFYCLSNGLSSSPVCSNPNCSNPVKWNGHHAFHRCCCHDCSVRDSITQLKSKNTCEKRYGTKFSWQSDSVKDKIKKSLMEKYGVDNPQKSEK